MAKTILLIDADPIVYRSGFAGEETQWEVVAEDAEGAVIGAKFAATVAENGRDKMTAWGNAKEWLDDNGLTLVEKFPEVVPDTLENVLNITRTSVAACIQGAARAHGVRESDLVPMLFLTGKDNFRENVATLLPYKGNRDKNHRPVHYEAIRKYLVSRWRAQIVHGMEADDELSIRARADKSAIVATIDKDLDQIPGRHYNYQEHVGYEVTELEAEHFFWQQIVSGDATDNIGGVPGIGKVKAERFIGHLEDCGHDFPAWWQEVVKLYAANRDHPKSYYKDSTLTDEEVALENARLVYMLREHEELWTPPGVQ